MEPSEHSACSPAGQVDRWGDLAPGLRSNRAGRRRVARMLAGLAVVVLLAVLVALLAAGGALP